ncbi:MAG: hypothetical protein AAFV53_22240 [Myxococcota bacterium]
MKMRPWMTVGLFGLCGCSGTLTYIEIDFRDAVTVEGGGLLSELVGALGFDGFTSMDLTDAQELQNQGVEPGDIQDVQLVTFQLTATSPSGADLSFINTMDVFASAPDLNEVQVASQDTFPAGQAQVDFTISALDLTEYVVSESMTLSTDVNGNQPVDDTEIEAYVVLDVGVTLQGALNQARN